MVKSLERAIDLLEIIYLHGGKITLAELTKLADANKTTVYRTLNTFVRKKVLNKDSVTAEYTLPNKAFQLNLISENNLAVYQYAQDAMHDLSKQYDTTVNLCVLDDQGTPLEINDDQGKLIRTVEQFNEEVHTSTLVTFEQCLASPIFQPAVYLCFMAFGASEAGSDDYLENYFKLNKRRLKPKKTYDLFQAEIAQIKQNGYVWCENEYKPDNCCLAFPILNAHKTIMASLSISFNAAQLAEVNLEALINQLMKISKSISYQWILDESKQKERLAHE